MKQGEQLESNFQLRFNELNLKFVVSDRTYSIKAINSPDGRAPFDFFINIGNTSIAIIEIKRTQFLKVFDYSRIEAYASEHDIKYFVLSDGEQFIVTDRNNSSEKSTLSFEAFVNLVGLRKEINIDNIKRRSGDLIKQVITESNFTFLRDHFDNLYQSILDQMTYDELSQRFFFAGYEDINNVENKIFRLLLKDDKPLSRIYRYTTLNTIYSCLKNNSYRINCLVGMNDTTEVNYAENYIFGTNRDYSTADWKRVETYNNRFISSCSMKKDDLTQWRLYAEDSKGVCMELKVDQNRLEGKFILKRISYGQKGGVHPELDLIRLIQSKLKDELDVNFDFKTINTWKHFFKPYDYAVEQEVRLLYIRESTDTDGPKKDWILTTSHQILNPYVDFKLNALDFPVKLSKIVLGPKCPEAKINKKQFQQYIRELRQNPEYNLRDVTVDISKINNYR